MNSNCFDTISDAEIRWASAAGGGGGSDEVKDASRYGDDILSPHLSAPYRTSLGDAIRGQGFSGEKRGAPRPPPEDLLSVIGPRRRCRRCNHNAPASIFHEWAALCGSWPEVQGSKGSPVPLVIIKLRLQSSTEINFKKTLSKYKSTIPTPLHPSLKKRYSGVCCSLCSWRCSSNTCPTNRYIHLERGPGVPLGGQQHVHAIRSAAVQCDEINGSRADGSSRGHKQERGDCEEVHGSVWLCYTAILWTSTELRERGPWTHRLDRMDRVGLQLVIATSLINQFITLLHKTVRNMAVQSFSKQIFFILFLE